MTITWSPALAPQLPSFYDEEPEALACPSVWYIAAERDRAAFSLTCDMDAGHPCDSVDGRHGNGLARWSDETAEESFAVYLASLGPRCTECSRPAGSRRLCGYHDRAERARDNYETPEVDAA